MEKFKGVKGFDTHRAKTFYSFDMDLRILPSRMTKEISGKDHTARRVPYNPKGISEKQSVTHRGLVISFQEIS
ncbi:MAG: hypothetical protein VKL39_19190 [Leptolyngbyaceae bacterium]|nr:hypothetical protein [Leptolyngbyaceae bacterium]